MGNVVQAHTFVTSETLTAVNLNANPAAFVAAFKNIDNTNIGTAGVFASQIIPLNTAQSTFGGAVGYMFSPGSPTQVPLTVSGVAGQSVDIFDVTLTSGGTKAISVDSKGGLVFSANQGILASSASVAITEDNGAIGGMIYNVPGSSTNGWQWFVNLSTVPMKLTTSGILTTLNYISAGSATQFGSLSSGDLSASRSVSTGVIRAGGSSTSVGIDWSVSAVNQVTFQTAASAFPQINAGPYNNVSDANLKQNIQALPHGQDVLMALKPVAFDWKHDGSPSLGFLAQDVEAILPELVSTNNDGVKGVNYDGIIPVLVKTLQDYISTHP